MGEALLEKHETGLDSRSAKELTELLRKGAYELIQEDEEQAEKSSSYYVETELDQILSKILQQSVDGEASAGRADGGGRAVHISGAHDDDVAMDDPEFWSKVLPAQTSMLSKLHDIIKGGKVDGEALKHFMTNLRYTCQPVLASRERGEDGGPEKDAVLALLIAATSIPSTISQDPESKAEIDRMITIIEGTKKRARTPVLKMPQRAELVSLEDLHNEDFSIVEEIPCPFLPDATDKLEMVMTGGQSFTYSNFEITLPSQRLGLHLTTFADQGERKGGIIYVSKADDCATNCPMLRHEILLSIGSTWVPGKRLKQVIWLIRSLQKSEKNLTLRVRANFG